MKTDKIVFEVFQGSSPFNGHPLYSPVFESDIIEYTGKEWTELTDLEKQEIRNLYHS